MPVERAPGALRRAGEARAGLSIHTRGLHPQVRPYADFAIQIAQHYGLTPTVTSTFRDWEEQLRLRRDWEAGRSQWPANRPGDSAHNWGLAWDSHVPDDQWPLWTAIREYVGFEVLPNDRIHAQVPDWRTWVRGLNA